MEIDASDKGKIVKKKTKKTNKTHFDVKPLVHGDHCLNSFQRVLSKHL